MTQSALHCTHYSFTPHPLTSGGGCMCNHICPAGGRLTGALQPVCVKWPFRPPSNINSHLWKAMWVKCVAQGQTWMAQDLNRQPFGIGTICSTSSWAKAFLFLFSCFDLDKKYGGSDLLPWRRDTQRERLTIKNTFSELFLPKQSSAY